VSAAVNEKQRVVVVGTDGTYKLKLGAGDGRDVERVRLLVEGDEADGIERAFVAALGPHGYRALAARVEPGTRRAWLDVEGPDGLAGAWEKRGRKVGRLVAWERLDGKRSGGAGDAPSKPGGRSGTDAAAGPDGRSGTGVAAGPDGRSGTGVAAGTDGRSGTDVAAAGGGRVA
jgi:hypothetical protein